MKRIAILAVAVVFCGCVYEKKETGLDGTVLEGRLIIESQKPEPESATENIFVLKLSKRISVGRSSNMEGPADGIGEVQVIFGGGAREKSAMLKLPELNAKLTGKLMYGDSPHHFKRIIFLVNDLAN